jgi:non-specific serine/threonine protein kinase
VEAALEKGAGLPPGLRIQATVAAEIMAYGQADNEAVVSYAGDLLELSHQVGKDAYAEAYANGGLGLVAMNRGDFDEATARLKEALPLFLESGEVWTAAQTHTWLGTVLLLQGEHELAVPRFEEGLALARRIGDRTGIYNALYTLAQVALVQGKLEVAIGSFEEGMSLSEEMGDRANVAYCLEGLATAAGAQGEAERAARLFGAARGLLETIGVPVWTSYKPDRSLYERTMNDLRARLGEAVFEAAEADGRAMTPEQAVEYALAGPPAVLPIDTAGLSSRELEVLRLVAEGLSDPQVAEKLYLSPRTVGHHLRSIYRKLGVSSRAAATKAAVERSLI